MQFFINNRFISEFNVFAERVRKSTKCTQCAFRTLADLLRKYFLRRSTQEPAAANVCEGRGLVMERGRVVTERDVAWSGTMRDLNF